VKSALQYTFHKTKGIEVNTPAVLIPFGYYASENLEVTPSQFKGMINTILGNFPLYLIPDGRGEWMQSSPKAHNKYVTTIDTKLRGKLKPLIQLIKAWKYMNDVPIISFYLELRITKLFENSIIFSYDEAVVEVLKHLYDKELSGIQDPMKVSGLIPATKTPNQRETALSKLTTALSRAEKAVAARKKDKIDDTFNWWNKLFNENFPAR